MRSERFWQALDELVESSEIVIDRPKGSRHPRYADCIYPLDYGYLAGTSASDGGGIDVWVGSLPEKRIVGIAATVDLVKRDTEVKILIGLTNEEIGIVHEFLNTGPMGAVTIKREG